MVLSLQQNCSVTLGKSWNISEFIKGVNLTRSSVRLIPALQCLSFVLSVFPIPSKHVVLTQWMNNMYRWRFYTADITIAEFSHFKLNVPQPTPVLCDCGHDVLWLLSWPQIYHGHRGKWHCCSWSHCLIWATLDLAVETWRCVRSPASFIYFGCIKFAMIFNVSISKT